MNRSDQIDQLAKALSVAQGMMEGASKDKTNPHFRSKYADLASVWDAIREPLSKNGLSVLQLPQASESGTSLETIIMHASGQWISASYCLPPVKSDPQGVGSAITYMKRYALAGVGVAPEDDDGEAASRPVPISPYSAKPTPPSGNSAAPANAGAAKWGNDAIATVRAFRDMADLAAWEAKNEKAMEKLNATDAPTFERLMAALADKYSALHPANTP